VAAAGAGGFQIPHQAGSQSLHIGDLAAGPEPVFQLYGIGSIATALGGNGELVTDPAQIGPALDRAFASGVPSIVNIVTDPADIYPRSSNLA
jgi:hypothetical protein